MNHFFFNWSRIILIGSLSTVGSAAILYWQDQPIYWGIVATVGYGIPLLFGAIERLLSTKQ